MVSILNIGCRNYKSDSQKTGGVVVLFEQWLDFCSQVSGDYNFNTIDSNKSNYKNKIIAFFKIVRSIISFSRKHKSPKIIFLHATYFDIMAFSPICFLCHRLYNTKVVMRKFGGNFDTIYLNSNILIKKYIKLILSSFDMCFWESKRLVKFGTIFNNHAYWFPNVRIKSLTERDSTKVYDHKLVFISRVEKEKGVIELAEVVKSLGRPYSLDIYGPVSGVDIETLVSPNVKYKGVLNPDHITEVLSQYDILCLPTYWKGEGYPGIIIEAFSAGIPVLSSEIGGIPELIQSGKNGFLIKKVDVEKIKEGIMFFNSKNYNELAMCARASFSSFDAKEINKRILNDITRLT